MPLERSRQLIGGVWRYVSAQQSDNGNGGSVPFVGVDAPPDPTDGMLWWDPDDDSPTPGSQTVPVSVNVAIAFDTPGLFLQDFPITAAAVAPANTLTIAGDHRDLFPAGATLGVLGSTGNDGSYEVVSSTLVGGDTVIATVEDVSDATADGVVQNVSTMGVVIYTPSPGDVVVPVAQAMETGFDGTTPTLYIQSEGDPLGENFGGGTGNIGSPGTPDTDGHNVQGSDPGSTSPVLMLDATPLRAVVASDGSGTAPGSTQGSGALVLVVYPAPS